MINYKLENNLQDWSAWHEVKMIEVKGDPEAQPFTLPDTVENADANEKVIQSWKKIAVFRATSQESAIAFKIGFIKDGLNLFINQDFETNLDYGMRVGPTDTIYYVLPSDLKSDIELKLVEITEENDEKYQDLIIL